MTTFRSRLALRMGGVTLALLLVGAFVGYRVLRNLLYEELDRTLFRLAAIEAAAAADTPDSEVHFHDDAFLGLNPGGEVGGLERYAEIWTTSGSPVVRTRNLGSRDLPLDAGVLRRVVGTSEPSLRTMEWDRRTFRSVLYPLGLVGPQHELHLLQVVASAEPTEGLLRGFLRRLVVMVAAGTLLAWGLGWWLARDAVRPVEGIVEQAESIAMAPGAIHRIEARTDVEELRRLVEVLNSMLARIEAAFESQRRFLSDVGHEIRTPLTVLRGDIEVTLRRPREREEYERVLRQTLADLRGASSLANDLLVLARGGDRGLELQREEVEVEPLFRDLVSAYRGEAERSDARLEVRASGDLYVRGDRSLLRHAVGGLVDNAIRYGGAGGTIELVGEAGRPGEVALKVVDHGPGIAPADRGRVFERFYRGEAGRRTGRGAGLGLSIAAVVTETHEGTVEVEDTSGGGTTVVLRLPGGRRPPA